METHNPETLIKNISDNRREIYAMEKSIIKRKEEIREAEKILYKVCDHEWKYDTSCGPYDRIKYQCIKCSLWRHPYMYT